MNIGIDGITFSHPQPGGYRTYTTNLIAHLTRLPTRHDYTLYLHQPVNFPFPANWSIKIVPTSLPVIGVPYREQVALPHTVKRLENSILHSPCATGPITGSFPRVVTLLDTIEFSTPLSVKQPRLWLMRQYSRLIQSRMAYLAERIITISYYSKAQIIKKFGIEAEKITVTHLAVAERFNIAQKVDAKTMVKNKLGLTDYILAMASASPRKNIDRLLFSYSLLTPSLRARFPLALIATHPALKGHLAQRITELGIQENVVFLNRASDDDLALLYQAAALFVFPSIEEGFGLPPLEAMACGTPVVASNTSSLPEVLGEAAILVPPTNTTAIAEAMNQVLTEPLLSETLAAKGLVQSQQFSWKKTARETLAVYESLA